MKFSIKKGEEMKIRNGKKNNKIFKKWKFELEFKSWKIKNFKFERWNDKMMKYLIYE